MFHSCSGYLFFKFFFWDIYSHFMVLMFSCAGTITFPMVVLPWGCTIKQQYCKKKYLEYLTSFPAELDFLFECKNTSILNIHFCSVEMLR